MSWKWRRTLILLWTVAVLLLLAPEVAWAQRRVRYDRQHLKNSPSMLEAASQVAGEAARGTVRILADDEPVALGTVVREDGFILTKASELRDGFVVELPDGRRLSGQVLGVLTEHDLAAIKVAATGLAAVEFSTAAVNNAMAGQWLASCGVGAEEVMKIGNLSVPGLRRIPGSGSLLGVRLGLPQAGVPVHRVDPGGPAAAAGLQPGDLIVLLNGTPIESMREFVRVLRNGPPDATYDLTISRNGRRGTVPLTLADGQAGVTLVTEAVGVMIEAVTPGSGAEAAGIKEGDIVLTIEGRQVRSPNALVNQIQAHNPGDVIEVTFLRGGEELSAAAKLGYHSGRTIRGDLQNNLGSRLSGRAVDFPAVFQHDTALDASQMGGPVLDLAGNVLGINIARAGRVETYALPAQIIEAAIPELLSGMLPTATAPALTETGAPPEPEVPENE